MSDEAAELISIVGYVPGQFGIDVVLLCECGHSWKLAWSDVWGLDALFVPQTARCPNRAKHDAMLAARREREALPSRDVEWPEDAIRIADEAGLGSYGPSPTAIRAALPDEVWDALVEVGQHSERFAGVEKRLTAMSSEVNEMLQHKRSVWRGIDTANDLTRETAAAARSAIEKLDERSDRLEAAMHWTRVALFVVFLALLADLAWRYL